MTKVVAVVLGLLALIPFNQTIGASSKAEIDPTIELCPFEPSDVKAISHVVIFFGEHGLIVDIHNSYKHRGMVRYISIHFNFLPVGNLNCLLTARRNITHKDAVTAIVPVAFDRERYRNCRGLPRISDKYFEVPFYFAGVETGAAGYSAYGQVCLNLLLANITGVIGHLSGSQESLPNEDNASGRYSSHRDSRAEHQERPKRHFSLGVQIAFGALMLIGGFYYVSYAFRQGLALSPGAAVLYLLLGMGGVFAGVGLTLALLLT